jgi:hypothetical protein
MIVMDEERTMAEKEHRKVYTKSIGNLVGRFAGQATGWDLLLHDTTEVLIT